MTSYGITLRAYSYFPIMGLGIQWRRKLDISEWQLFGFESTLESSNLNNEKTLTVEFNSIIHGDSANLKDKSVLTKYCTVIRENTLWIKYNSPTAVKTQKNVLVSANDAPERNSANCTLYCSNVGNVLDVLDSRNNHFFNSS